MQVAESRHDLSPVESGSIFWEHSNFWQVIKQLPAVNVLHYKAQTIRGLEGIFKMLWN